MSINTLNISYPDFKLLEVIDPEQFDINNDEIVDKVNELVGKLNVIVESVADGNSGADNVSLTTILPFAQTKLQPFLEALVAKLTSTSVDASGAEFVGAQGVSGLTGNNVQTLIESLKTFIDNVQAQVTTNLSTYSTHKAASVLDHPDSSVTEAKIANGAVTNAKLGALSVDEGKLASNSVSATKIKDGAVTLSKLDLNSVSTDKIVSGAVTDAKLADNSVTRTKIINGAVGSNQIEDASVTSTKLSTDSVNTTKIVDGSVNTAKLADSSVTSAKIANGSITAAKLAVDATVNETVNALRIDALEDMLDTSVTTPATINQGTSILNAVHDCKLTNISMRGRSILNLCPLFNSGLWVKHSNAVFTSERKLTLNATAASQETTILIAVSPNTTYTIQGTLTTPYGVYGYIWVTKTSGSVYVIDTTTSGKYSKTITTGPSDTTIELHLSGRAAGTFVFEDISVNLGSTAQDFVKGLQSINNVAVIAEGKNLAPTFASNKWSANGWTIDSATKLSRVISDGVQQYASIDINVARNTDYTLSGIISGSGSAYGVFTTGDIPIVSYTTGNITFNSGTNDTIRIYLRTGTTNGTHSFENVMLNVGATALPFEEQCKTHKFFYGAVDDESKFELMSNPLQTVYDEFDGEQILRRFKRMSMDGTKDWSYVSDATGYKVFRFPLNGTITDEAIAIKYDGKPLKLLRSGIDPATGADQFSIDSAWVSVTVSDSDHGLGETWAGTATLVNGVSVSAQNLAKAIFNGWKFVSASTGWQGIIDTAQTTTDQNYVINNYSNGFTPPNIQYQLANPVPVSVISEGEVEVFEGANQITMLAGVQVREAVTPKLIADLYRINDASDTGSYTKYRTNEILNMHKDNLNDSLWKFDTSGANGSARGLILPTNFDQTAAYSATYLPLDMYKIGIAPMSIDAEYQGNLGTVLKQVLTDSVDLREELDVVKNNYARKQQGQHTQLTLVNGATHLSGSPVEYFVDDFGELHFRGVAQVSGIAAGTIIGYLPINRRPTKYKRIPTIQYSSLTDHAGALIEINQLGEVRIGAAGKTFLLFDIPTMRVGY